MFRGLRQGDPIFPFLFIIVVEGLHVVIEDAVAAGVFCGAPLGSDDVSISHLFYANDTFYFWVNGMS